MSKINLGSPLCHFHVTQTNQRLKEQKQITCAVTLVLVVKACFLSGHDREAMLEIIEVDGVDLNVEGLIEKRSLWEFQEALVLVRHWHD